MIVATWTQFQAVWFDCNQQDMGGLPWVFAMSYHVLPIWINQQHVIFSSKKFGITQQRFGFRHENMATR